MVVLVHPPPQLPRRRCWPFVFYAPQRDSLTSPARSPCCSLFVSRDNNRQRQMEEASAEAAVMLRSGGPIVEQFGDVVGA
ncbi:unnamed protein product [Linum trigynum]|uniref:Uncharacterized protein n=1 Tax=Linum trigynum TaxID=586398 RepID=A0AAV2D017_9ROSI